MTIRFISFMSALALTALAGAASAGDMPASGEQPYAEYGVGQSTVSRAEVMAAAIAAPPSSGEWTHFDDYAGYSSVTRAEVMAAAVATPPAAGEMNHAVATARATPYSAGAVTAGLRQPLNDGYQDASVD